MESDIAGVLEAVLNCDLDLGRCTAAIVGNSETKIVPGAKSGVSLEIMYGWLVSAQCRVVIWRP